MSRYPQIDDAVFVALGGAEWVQWVQYPTTFAVVRRCVPGMGTGTGIGTAAPLLEALHCKPRVVPHDRELAIPEPLCVDGPDTTVCFHNARAVLRISRSERNPGRAYFCCQTPVRLGKCNFFRWQSDLLEGVYGHLRFTDASAVRLPTPLSEEVQEEAWNVQQGTERWLQLRENRLTASCFGSIHGTNPYCSPEEHMDAMLRPRRIEGQPLKYGSVNEHVAFELLGDMLRAEVGEENMCLQDKGIWIAGSPLHFMGGSPDGILYLVEQRWDVGDDMELLQVSRFLIEIKCPWAKRGAACATDPFYDLVPMRGNPDLMLPIPSQYQDQVEGNCKLIGLKGYFFAVLHNKGLQVTYVEHNAEYTDTQLLPALLRFYEKYKAAKEKQDAVAPPSV